MSDLASDKAPEPERVEVGDEDQIFAEDSVGAPTAALSGEGVLTIHPVGILITTHLWFTWLQVAIDRAKAAHRVREEMMRLLSEGKQVADLLGSEFEASVVAIAACAHALDALYGSEVIPEGARGHGQNRPAKIREALKRVFKTGPVNGAWVGSFDRLFNLRDAAVHAREKPAPPELHPAVGHTSKENASYTVESAKQAVDFVLSVFRWCIDNPRPEAAAWAGNMHPMVEQLENRWLGTAA